jgi:hypothetical protein
MAKKKTAKKKAPKRRAKAKTAKKNSSRNASAKRPKRKPGRPKARDLAVTPEILERITHGWLEGRTQRPHHLRNHIRPLWQREIVVDVKEVLARVEHLYAVAWAKFHESQQPERREVVEHALTERSTDLQLVRSVTTQVERTGEVCWADVIKWCIDFAARVGGLYAAKRLEVSHRGEVRIAGKSPSDFDEETFTMLLEKMDERRRYEAALQASGAFMAAGEE